MNYDDIDIRILEILQDNAKATIKEMANELGLSTTPIFERIKRLEAQDVITKCHHEVIECHHVTGDSDFLIVLLTKDIETYNDFITKKLFKVSNVGKVRSSFSLSVKKQATAISLSK